VTRLCFADFLCELVAYLFSVCKVDSLIRIYVDTDNSLTMDPAIGSPWRTTLISKAL
jgi:hypothetical protein